jgi:predicted nucleic acid-binding protein
MAMTTVDSSVLVAALQSWHAAHEPSAAVVRAHDLRVGSHVLLETYSVLTGGRSRPRSRPAAAVEALRRFAVAPMTLSDGGYLATLRRCAEKGVVGGAVYDALIAATARESGARLISRDRRAARTYDAIGVDHDLIV